MSEEILAPLAGTIIAVNIEIGIEVEEDEEIFVIEAMKMETPVFCPCGGKVKGINVKKGDKVEEDDILAVIED
ncbi:MAG: acetyl-CoA carboxylase biotin carboxyl carrier protein subunit [Desulfobacteraceae bacterium]|nr:acetyl-CoA carboxylase biotin carboxyl carrier protein subunit [Desulfobacteraceae bacterium]MBC2753876.1 acetyl-CoA carboxylase biotin carboxyl carrier protein subunit [Desulfobacteraceae bacterium]